MRALIVDDSAYMRKILADIVLDLKWEISGEAGTGEEAIESYKKLRPDIVLMDVVMPGIGGIEATRKIKVYDPSAKVVLITAVGTQIAIMDEAIAAGGEKTYVTKPFDNELVKEVLMKIASA